MARDKTFNFRVTASGIDQLRRDLEALGPAGQKAFDQLKQSSPSLENALNRAQSDAAKARVGLEELGRAGKAAGTEISTAMQNAVQSLGPVGGVLASLGGGATAAAAATVALGTASFNLARAADNYTLLESRIRLVTGSAGAARDAMQQLFGVAQASGSGFAETVGSFQRLAFAARDIGASTGDVIALSDAVQKLGRLSGATGSELQAGMQQFAQSLASGRLQGDELRSVMENMPLLARAIADGLGVSVGELREMGANGELVAERIFPAILSQLGKINAQFAGMPRTVDQSVQGIRNEFEGLIADIGKAANASPFWNWYLNDYVGGAVRGARSLFRSPTPAEEIASLDREIATVQGTRGVTAGNATLRDLQGRRAVVAAAVGDEAFIATVQAAERAEQQLARQREAVAKIIETLAEGTREHERQAELRRLTADQQKIIKAGDDAIAKGLKDLGYKSLQDIVGLRHEEQDAILVGLSARREAAEADARAAIAAEKAADAKKKQADIEKELAKNAAALAAQQDQERLAAQKRGAEIIAADEKRNRSLADYIAGLEQAAAAEGLSATEKEVQLALTEAQNKLVDEQGNRLRELTELEKERVAHAVRQKEALEEQRRAAEKFAQDVQRTADRVLGNISDAGADVLFARWKGQSADLWSSFKDYAMRALFGLASEGLTNALFRPFVSSAVSALPGFFGISGGGRTGVNTGTGGGFNLGLPDLLGFGKWAAGGFQLSANPLATLGGTLAGGLGIGAGSGFAAVGSSAALAAEAAGLGATVTGGYGALAGSAAAGGGATAALSPLALTGIGAVAAIGGGLLLSSLMGDEEIPWAKSDGRIGANGAIRLSGTQTLDGGDAGPMTEVLRGISQTLQQVTSITGASIRGNPAIYAATGRWAGDFMLKAMDREFSGNPDQATTKLVQALASGGRLTGLSDVERHVIGRSRSTADLVSNVEFAQLYESLANLQRVANADRDAFEQLSKTIDETSKRARSLGLSVPDLLEGAAANFNQDVKRLIDGIVDPVGLALRDFAEVEKARLDYAKKIGADIVEVERLNALQRQQILQQSGTDLKAWLDGQLLGPSSTLSGEGRLAEAQSQLQAAMAANDNSRVLSLADLIAGQYRDLFGGTAGAASGIDALRQQIAAYGRAQGLPGFADGGVSYRPQLAMVSEGRYPVEAHVPLPDGRAIPVRFENDGAKSADIGELALIISRQGALLERLCKATEQVARDMQALKRQGELQLNQALAQSQVPKKPDLKLV